MAYFQLKYLGVHLHGLDMRNTIYTNSIIKTFFKAQNELYHMTYAVKTVEHWFSTWMSLMSVELTWVRHDRHIYTKAIINEFFKHKMNRIRWHMQLKH